jgi:2,3-bisphosphoglycerate-dependent phosphoglycerate mutase
VITSVYLVRHAHAHWEPSEERPLSDQGRAAATNLSRCLGSAAISAIYSSPARRAIETIQPLANAHGLHPEIVPDLRERHLTVMPGETFETAVETAWRNPATGQGGTEPNVVAATRGVGVLQQIIAARQGESVVVATHGNLLALMLNALDPAYGYEIWRTLTFPDIYKLQFRGNMLLHVERVWAELPQQHCEPGP